MSFKEYFTISIFTEESIHIVEKIGSTGRLDRFSKSMLFDTYDDALEYVSACSPLNFSKYALGFKIDKIYLIEEKINEF